MYRMTEWDNWMIGDYGEKEIMVIEREVWNWDLRSRVT